MCFKNTCLCRQAIDNRLNRDFIRQAREQGFVFSDPFADAARWKKLEAANLENPAQPSLSREEADWLLVVAFEAALFFIYQQNRRTSVQRPVA